MSYADQLRDLATSGAAMRLEAHGVNNAGTAQLGRMSAEANPAHTFACYVASAGAQEALQSMMLFKDVEDSIVVRVGKDQQYFDPTNGLPLLLLGYNPDNTDKVVRISEVKGHPSNPEWVASCKLKW